MFFNPLRTSVSFGKAPNNCVTLTSDQWTLSLLPVLIGTDFEVTLECVSRTIQTPSRPIAIFISTCTVVLS